VSADGWYDGVPLSVYHSAVFSDGISVSSSGLRTLWRKSPKHFYANWPYNPNADEADTEESSAFVIGRAAHHLYLGEDDFSLQFIERRRRSQGSTGMANRTECKAFLKQQAQVGRTC